MPKPPLYLALSACAFVIAGCERPPTPLRLVTSEAATAIHLTADRAAQDMAQDQFWSMNGRGPYVVEGVVTAVSHNSVYNATLAAHSDSHVICHFGKVNPGIRVGQKVLLFADEAQRESDDVGFWPCRLLPRPGSTPRPPNSHSRV